jgi:hypothetical protein
MSSSLKDKKAKLHEESDQYEESLNEEFSEFSEKAVDLAGKALIIGGAALVSYLVVKAILGKDKKEENEEDRVQERIIIKESPQQVLIKSLMNKSVLVLLELGREVLIKFLREIPEKDEA